MTYDGGNVGPVGGLNHVKRKRGVVLACDNSLLAGDDRE